jgi:hypothetical protein
VWRQLLGIKAFGDHPQLARSRRPLHAQ